MRTRNPLLLIAALGLGSLVSTSLAGCAGGELMPNEDDRPQILTVRFIDNGTERDNSADGQRVNLASSVVGPAGSCRNGGATAILRDIRLAVYMTVPNTQAELDIDAFVSLVEQDGLFARNPVSIKSVERPQVLFNTPGSAEGTIKVEVQLLFEDPGNFTPTALARGTASSGSTNVMVDDEGSFESLGVQPGFLVVNNTSHSFATIINVFGDTNIQHSELQEGDRNFWLPGDEYSITNANLCVSSTEVQYDYSVQVVVVDPDFRGDSITLPIVVVDNTASLCKASSTLCD